MSLAFSWASFTDQGPRAENEDAVAVWQLGDDLLGAAVADGLGGHVGGKQASSLALEVLGNAIHRSTDLDLALVAREAHSSIRAEQERSPTARSMATTLSAALLTGNRAHIVHCGDSRIALSRGEGIMRLTEDHTEAQRFLQSGLLTPAEYRQYPRKNVLDSALGIHGEPRIDTSTVDLIRGDRLFFTSDGTHEKVALQELRTLSLNTTSPAELCEAVRALVLERTAADNFSLVAVYVN